MRREIHQFVRRNGGWHHAQGVGQLLIRWEAAARHVALWRQKQIFLGDLSSEFPVIIDEKTINGHSN